MLSLLIIGGHTYSSAQAALLIGNRHEQHGGQPLIDWFLVSCWLREGVILDSYAKRDTPFFIVDHLLY